VVGLEWVLSQPSLLAVLLYPATLLLWDPKGELQREGRAVVGVLIGGRHDGMRDFSTDC
jgi:hypothetical protein